MSNEQIETPETEPAFPLPENPYVRVEPQRFERLGLWRRRLNIQQSEAAEVFEVSVQTYRNWEGGLLSQRTVPDMKVGNLMTRELCFILRRRHGWSQKDLAEQMDCSTMWVNQMESGKAPVKLLAEFWGV